MKFAKKLSLSLSLAAALSFSAQAQDAKLKVTLPHDAQIGDAVLAAGAYTITLSMEGITMAVIAPADHYCKTRQAEQGCIVVREQHHS